MSPSFMHEDINPLCGRRWGIVIKTLMTNIFWICYFRIFEMMHAWLQWKWYTCYPSLQLKTNATQAELTHAIIIIIMPWLYCCCSVCIWFRFMVRQPKFGNIKSEKISEKESRGSLMWKGKELKRCMTNWWFACIWLRATNRHKHSFWHLVL